MVVISGHVSFSFTNIFFRWATRNEFETLIDLRIP